MPSPSRFPEPTHQDVISALEQTGFVLEQQVAKTIVPLEWDDLELYLNEPFEDPETGKSREIDVLALDWLFAGDSALHAPLICTELIIECKNYNNPIAVVGSTRRGYYDSSVAYKPSFDPLSLFGFEGLYSARANLELLDLPNNPWVVDFYAHRWSDWVSIRELGKPTQIRFLKTLFTR